MKNLTNVVDIYYSVKPLCIISKIIGLTDTRSTNKIYRLQILNMLFSAFLVVVLLSGLYISVTQEIHSQIPHATVQVIIVWILSIMISYLTSIITLILNATCNKASFLNILSNISRVDHKMFTGNLKRNIYIRRRKSIILQLITLLLLYGTSSAFAFFFSYPELHSQLLRISL
jgi:uncharacterized BrkB/YihY/UPF0761 family membrane protein